MWSISSNLDWKNCKPDDKIFLRCMAVLLICFTSDGWDSEEPEMDITLVTGEQLSWVCSVSVDTSGRALCRPDVWEIWLELLSFCSNVSSSGSTSTTEPWFDGYVFWKKEHIDNSYTTVYITILWMQKQIKSKVLRTCCIISHRLRKGF